MSHSYISFYIVNINKFKFMNTYKPYRKGKHQREVKEKIEF